MKKRPLVLILLLLLLLSLTPKDVTAVDVDESSESITSFSETLADNQMYYPDDEDCLGFGGYFESFKDVSDWTEHWFEAGDSSSTDGDVLSIEAAGDSAGDLDRFYTNDPSFTAEGYMEIRWRVNQTIINYIYFVAWTQDTMSGSTTILSSAPPSDTSWHTQKLYISQAIECVELRISTTAGAKTKFDIDYIRIGPANESGWQHDGSATGNVTSVEAGKVTLSSDGDVLRIENTDSNSPKAAAFWIDQTTTVSHLDIDYYPFLSVNVTDIEAGGEWMLWLYDNSTLTKIHGPTSEVGVFRFNIKAGYGLDPNRVYIYAGGIISNDKWVDVSWVKAYSIANFTVTQSAVTTDDVLYVDSGILYSSIDDGYIESNLDPALTVSNPTYNVWNGTTQTTAPQSAYYVSSWSDYSSETRGPLASGTLTDLKLNFTTDASLSAIKFIDVRDWQEINDVELMFQVNWSPEFQFGYDAFFIFLGLIMIPASTMYLVRGGRKEMNTDKLFYGLIIFALGIGFLIGGILP